MFSASTSSCYPQIVSLDENAELQSVISDVLLTHNCDMDDVNVDISIWGSGYMVEISKTTNLHARKKEVMKNKISRRDFL